MSTIIKNRKHFLVVFLFLFSLSGNILAQSDKEEKGSSKSNFFTFGPKVSVNFTNVNFSKDQKTELLPGVDAGLFFRFSISRLYIQPEVNYVFKSTKFKDAWEEINTNVKYKTHNIGVPVLVGLHAVNAKNFKLRIFAGPEVNIRLDDNIKELGSKELWSSFKYGLQAGVGVDIWRFTVDASYSFLACKNLDELRSNIKFSNNNILKVGVGFKFIK